MRGKGQRSIGCVSVVMKRNHDADLIAEDDARAKL